MNKAWAASACLLLAFSLTGCGASAPTPAQETTQQTAQEETAQDAQQQATQDETAQADAVANQEPVDYTAQRQEEMQVAAKFIDAYDQRPGVSPIVPGTAFDPQKDGSEYAKSEFSDEAFSGSYGVHWTSGSIRGDIITFQSAESVYGILVYAIGPQRDINGFYRDAITVMDPEVDQNALSAAITSATTGEGNGSIDGCDLAVTTYVAEGENSGVVIGSYDFSQTEVPQEKQSDFDESYGYAILTLEEYGKGVYPYGFDLHKILGVQVADHPNPDEWEFQITCDVTNEYGATAKDQVCNATVKLIDGTWQVTDFSVH